MAGPVATSHGGPAACVWPGLAAHGEPAPRPASSANATDGDHQGRAVAEVEVPQSLCALASFVVRHAEDRLEVNRCGGFRCDAQLCCEGSRDSVNLGKQVQLSVVAVLRLLERHDGQPEPLTRRRALCTRNGLRRRRELRRWA